MAAILNGFLPAKKKDQYSHLNTRWGDAAISAPMHGGWNTSGNATQPQESPDLERDLPPTPPQHIGEVDGVFIVHDEEEGNRSGAEIVEGQDRDNVTLTMSLPAWKRKVSHNRNQSQSASSVLNPKFAPQRRGDPMPSLGTAEAAATIPLPDSRVSSPVARTTTTPVLSFRSRLANPNLSDILSPVAEGFAKDGPSTRPVQIMSSLMGQDEPTERPSTASSLRSNMPRRPSVNAAYVTAAYNSEGLGGMTMSSQAGTDEQQQELSRPQSRGIGATAHMRASSRGPRASSRGPRSTSVEPIQRAGSVEPIPRRAPSVEPVTRRAPSVEPVTRRAPSVEPLTRRAPSVEPMFRRAPSVEPVAYRSTSVEPQTRRVPSVEPYARRAPSVEPIAARGQSIDRYAHREHSVEPYTRRAPSVEPIGRRGQSVDQYSRRGHSVEPFTRRGQSVEPVHYQDQADASPVIPPVYDLEPLRRRAPSVEPGRRRAPSVDPGSRRGLSLEPALRRGKSVEPNAGRAPSIGPPSSTRRAQSREPRGRRGASVEPKPRVRFHSEVARRTHRRDSFSSNDGSLESDEDKSDFDPKHFSPPSRVDPDFTSSRKPRRRRSIASPMVSPTIATFAAAQNNAPSPPPALITNFDSITSRAGIHRPIITPVEKRPASRNRSQSRTRGLYADLHDDFSMLAREVHSSGRRDTPIEPPLLIPQLPRNILNSSQRTASPIVGPHASIYQAGIGTLVTHQYDPDRTRIANPTGYTSDSSQNMSFSNNNLSDSDRPYDNPNGSGGARAVLASITRDRHDQLRREEREKAREKVTKKLERERERVLAVSALGGASDCDSLSGSGNGSGSGSDRTRRVYGSSVASDSEVEGGRREMEKVLVPNDEDIWG